MNKKITAFLTSAIAVLLSTIAFASPEISVFVDGQQVTYPTAPVMQNGTTLVPLRQTFNSLGASVDFDKETSTIISNKDNTKVVLTIGENVAYKNGYSFNISVAPQIINGSTFVPLRFVAESFDTAVSWDGATQTVNINNESSTNTQMPINIVEDNELGFRIENSYLIYDNEQYKIINVDGGDLSGDRKPNVAVDIGFGNREYWGLTNQYGQLVTVLAEEII